MQSETIFHLSVMIKQGQRFGIVCQTEMSATRNSFAALICINIRTHSRTVAMKSSLGGLYVRVGGLCVCAGGGLDIEKLIKPPIIYGVSYFNLEGLLLCLGGISPPKLPVETGLTQTYKNFC